MPLTDEQLLEILRDKNKVYTKQSLTSSEFLKWMKDSGYNPPSFKGRKHPYRPCKTYMTVLNMFTEEYAKECVQYNIPIALPLLATMRVYETETYIRNHGFNNYYVETPFDSTMSPWLTVKLMNTNYLNRTNFVKILTVKFIKKWVNLIKEFDFPKNHFVYIPDKRKNRMLHYMHVEKAITAKKKREKA